VSIASVMERNPTPRFSNAVTVSRQAAAEPIQLPNNQDVSLTRIVQRLSQTGPIGTRSRSAVFEHLGTSRDRLRKGTRSALFCSDPNEWKIDRVEVTTSVQPRCC